jgi:hypothetical protein
MIKTTGSKISPPTSASSSIPATSPLHPRRNPRLHLCRPARVNLPHALNAEFLRIDFPRVPFPDSAEDFETLSGLGWALVQAHLLRELPRQKLALQG